MKSIGSSGRLRPAGSAGRCVGRLAALLLSVSLSLGVARGQQDEGWQPLDNGHSLRLVGLPAARAQAITVVWPNEFRRDPNAEKALALAVAGFRLQRARVGLPEGARASVEVLDGMTLYHLRLPVGSDLAAKWLSGLMQRPDPDDDSDNLQLALARNALAADDASWLFPGPVLRSRARIALASGTAAGADLLGSPTFLQHCPLAELADAVGREPGSPLRVVVVGHLDGAEALRKSVEAIKPHEQSHGRHTSLPVEASFSEHPRVDGAFVGAAIATPRPSAEAIPFALMVELVRERAAEQFGSYRGGEAAAQAPFVTYSFLTGGSVLLICRRGPNFSDNELPREEIERLLQSFRESPPRTGALQAAVLRVQAEWAVPPWAPRQVQALVQNPEGLAPRARSLALLGHWGVTDAVVRELDTHPGVVGGLDNGTVAGLLKQSFRADQIWWGGLDPRPLPIDSQWR
ncbi:MAG: hypothetical protein VYE77_07550 [Planctomycetota bacterium]|nr:hypothetical protein [Planctomycetota bacterium]